MLTANRKRVIYMTAAERLIRYAKVHTTSDEDSGKHPSTERQRDLAELLYDELRSMGINAYYDKDNCYVYAKLPASAGYENRKTVGFIAHLDTSPEASGENVSPRIVDYTGGDIILNSDKNIILSPDAFPELKKCEGQQLIVTDGTTLLGADDKAGIAEIMTMLEYFTEHPDISHPEIAAAFTPDEEVGAGTVGFDLERFGADFAYTVDGGPLGELEYETFNAASADITVTGRNVHTGLAKDKMINAAEIACLIDRALPENERPQYTDRRDGFFHLLKIEGTTDCCTLKYLIRDFDDTGFARRKDIMRSVCDSVNARFGSDTAALTIKDTYYNMRRVIEDGNMFTVQLAEKVMCETGITPIIQPIRGGTDGSSLSFRGLPCPNLCTGGNNFHSVYEYACVQSMEKITELLINICRSEDIPCK